MAETDSSDTDYTDGKEFTYVSEPEDFDRGIFMHQFELNFTTRSVYLPSSDQALYGPMNGDETSQYGFYAAIGAFSMFCNVGMLFLIVVLLYWWLSSAKLRRKRWETAMREPEEPSVEKREEPEETKEEEGEFICTSCGAAVSTSHNFCPKCGEKFNGIVDEEPEKDSE